MINEIEIEKEYYLLKPKYQDIAGILKGVFEDQLDKRNIGFERVDYRIKSWDSFLDKIARKSYDNPIEEIHDLCGFRIILRNSAELDKVAEILKVEFDILESDFGDSDLSSNQFGYRSFHMIISIKKEWQVAPQFRDCKNLKFEIQIRSVLMDVWAHISHQIFYKKTDLSKAIERRLFRLSALMEIGDSEISQLIEHQSKNNSIAEEMKALQDILDKYLPDRKKTPGTPLLDLLKEMELYNFTLENLISFLEVKKDELFKIEEEAFSHVRNIAAVESRWWQIGIVRGFMYLTIDEYWYNEGTKYAEHFVSVINLYRKNFKNEAIKN